MPNQSAVRAVPRVLLVTGAASGIGQALAGALLARGDCVAATDMSADALAHSAAGWPSKQRLLAALDVRDAAAWEALLDEVWGRWGRLDVLCNVAGHMQAGYAHEAPLEEVEQHLDVNVKGVILGTRAAARRMVAQGNGHIVNMASLTAIAPTPGLSLYSASKFAVRGFSLAARLELRPHNVHLSVLCPDAVATPMLDRQRSRPEAAMSFHARQPLTPEQVVATVLNHVLPHRPPEVILPRHNGWLAKLTMLNVPLAQRLTPLFVALGRRHQQRGGGAAQG